MKFYVILLVVYNDSTADKKAIYEYDSEDAVLQGFYKYMSQFVNVDNVSTVNVEAKNSVGGVYKNETWTHPVVATTVDETTTADDTTTETTES